MIHVAIICAKNSPTTGRSGRFCPALEDDIPVDDVSDWHAKTLAEHAWTVDDDGNAYCPRHNPDDAGTIWSVTHVYRPIGDSGWEARLPEDWSGGVDLEIRPCRGGDDECQD